MHKTSSLEKATFGAGCFWGVEETFRNLPGVKKTAVGFMGGTVDNVSYETVCNENTGHAEVVDLEFDPQEISYEKLLDVFWKNHNPTTFNRQGPDVGSQYRSVIFFHTPQQEKLARESKETLGKSRKWEGRQIVTQIIPAKPFWRAEEYHQQHLVKRGLDSCHI